MEQKSRTSWVWMTVVFLLVLSAAPALGHSDHVRAASACAIAVPVHHSNCLSIAPVGHRGKEYAAEMTNENTIAALEVDRIVGSGCETDTWRLAGDDGSLNQGISVIFHDDTLGRVISAESLATAGLSPSANMGQVTRSQFETLRTKGGQPLPTLQEWIRYASMHKINCRIEIKWTPGDAGEVAGWIKAYGGTRYISFYARPLPASGNYPCSVAGLNYLRKAGIRTGIKTGEDCPMSLEEIRTGGYRYIAADLELLSIAYIQKAHVLGLYVGNKRSDDRTVWANLVRWNADFVIASRPGVLVQWLGRST